MKVRAPINDFHISALKFMLRSRDSEIANAPTIESLQIIGVQELSTKVTKKDAERSPSCAFMKLGGGVSDKLDYFVKQQKPEKCQKSSKNRTRRITR